MLDTHCFLHNHWCASICWAWAVIHSVNNAWALFLKFGFGKSQKCLNWIVLSAWSELCSFVSEVPSFGSFYGTVQFKLDTRVWVYVCTYTFHACKVYNLWHVSSLDLSYSLVRLNTCGTRRAPHQQTCHKHMSSKPWNIRSAPHE